MKTTNITSVAAAKLALQHPFWTEIFYSMTPNVAETEAEEKLIPTAATDGRLLYLNEGFYKKLNLDAQIAVCAHELAHKVFLHPYRRGARDPRIWNYACDYAVNALLRDNHFKLPEPHLFEEKYKGMSAEAIYQELMKNPPPEDPNFTIDLMDPDGTPEELEAEAQEVKAMVAKAVANAKAFGKLPAGIDGGLIEAFRAPAEAWYNRLARYMQSLSESAYNWSQLNRRTLRTHGYFSPMRKDTALGEIWIMVDCSGSVFDKAQQAGFCGHINSILGECRPKKTFVNYFDTQVYEGEEVDPGTVEIKLRPKGGGGTSFRMLFEWIEEHGGNPDVVIVLTDLYGDFPTEMPDYPVVWACISGAVAPFGDTIKVE